ncbi:MAG: hypothetical protein J2P25_26240, partial [Nocardiopsaceae bacterium]|nr:hypothetical protein [Nocardiopsaceae bacterium]
MTPDAYAALEAAGLPWRDVERVVRDALAEDYREGPDITSSATVGDAGVVTGDVVARENGVLAGVPVAMAVADLINELGHAGYGVAGYRHVSATALRADGDRVTPGDAVLRVSGSASGVLGAERTMLNFLTHLSGIATATRAWADAVGPAG